MKTLLAVVGLVGTVGIAGAQNYTADLNADQEVPVNTAETGNLFVYGSGNFTLSGSTLTCTFGLIEVSSAPLTATLNEGAPGSNGPVIFSFTLGSNIDPVSYIQAAFSGSGTLTSQQIDELNAGNLYVNVTTTTFPTGEIRGEVVPEPTSLALLGAGALALVARKRRQQ